MSCKYFHGLSAPAYDGSGNVKCDICKGFCVSSVALERKASICASSPDKCRVFLWAELRAADRLPSDTTDMAAMSAAYKKLTEGNAMIEAVTVNDNSGAEISRIEEAAQLHNSIVANYAIAGQALFETCKGLKRMRDDKLYIQLGYSDFGDYCETHANIKRRQAYNYIKAYEDLDSQFLQSNANIGITKLELLTHVPALDRAEFVETNDIEDISVSELKAKIDQLERDNARKGEQLSLLQEQLDEAVSETDNADELAQAEIETDKLKDKIAKLEAEVKARNAEVKAATDKAVRAAIDKERKALAKQTEDSIKAKTDELAAQISDYERKLADKDASISAAVAKQADMESKLRAASQGGGDGGISVFKVYFESMQDSIDKLFGALDAIEDSERQSKFARSVVAMAEEIKATAGDY